MSGTGESAFRRVRALFEEALDLPAGERAALLEARCAGDEALRAEVDGLLAAHGRGETFLTPPSTADVATALGRGLAPVEPGSSVGGFVIRRVLGSGGMGTVYEAEQQNPRRRVALKVMRWGLASAAARERFRYEAEVLARLRHPNIAQVHAAGVERREGGVEWPWLALELVEDATPLLDCPVAHDPDHVARLRLFLAVCEAVHHGHQNGVIHRDLKSGNILVDGDGRPKVIDFGVARAVERDAAATAATQAGEVVGTLQSMSPEQLEGDPGHIDTRTDVYALGVVLYELLTGRPPLELSGLPFSAVLRRVREEAPRPPSQVAPGLPADLDWVVLKALEKERDRRYASVAELADDLRRVLHHEPVLAGPPSALYRARKFVRRHRVGVTAAALLLVTLVVGSVGTGLGLLAAIDAREDAEHQTDLAVAARRAAEQAQAATAVALAETERQRGLAEEAARTSEAVVDLMLDLFQSPDPAIDGRDVKIVDSLSRSDAFIGEALAGQPAVESRLRRTIGSLYYKLGVGEDAVAHLTQAWEQRAALSGPDDPVTLEVRGALGLALVSVGDLDGAEGHLEAVHAAARARFGEGAVETLTPLNNLAFLYQHQGRWAEAEASYRRVLDLETTLWGERDPRTLVTRQNLGALFMGAIPPRLAEADAELTPTLELMRETLHPDHPERLKTLNNMAALRLQQRRYKEAVPLLEESLERRGRLLPPEHRDILIGRGNLAALYFMRGEFDTAMELYEENLAVRREHYPRRDVETIKILGNLASTQHWAGDHAAEAAWLAEIVALDLGAEAENLGQFLPVDRNLVAQLEWGHGDHAEPLIRAMIAGQQRLAPADELPALLWNNRGRLANALELQQRFDEAEALFIALEQELASLPDGEARRPILDREYGTLLTARGRFDEAEQRLLRSWAVLGPRYGVTERGTAVGELVALFEAQGREADAAEWRARLPSTP